MEFVKCVMFLHYNEKIKTTRDQVATQSNIVCIAEQCG